MRKPIVLALLTLAVVAGGLALSAIAADPPLRPAAGGLLGISKPSEDRTISFNRPGKVEEMIVHEGDEVKAKQVVARQNDDEEKRALEYDETKAKDQTAIEAETKVWESKKVDLQKMTSAKVGSVGPLELEAARLEVTVEEARIKMALQQNKLDNLTLMKTVEAIKKLNVESPIDGVVAQTFLDVGETADGGNMKVMRVIQVDPMYVEVPVPILDANKLKKDDVATITFSDKPRQGRIILIFPFNDSGSQTRLIRLKVPNPEKLQPGEIVKVDFALPGVVRK